MSGTNDRDVDRGLLNSPSLSGAQVSSALGPSLRDLYQEQLDAQLPDHLVALLDRLAAAEQISEDGARKAKEAEMPPASSRSDGRP